jgi:hypothetical protein
VHAAQFAETNCGRLLDSQLLSMSVWGLFLDRGLHNAGKHAVQYVVQQGSATAAWLCVSWSPLITGQSTYVRRTSVARFL